MESLDRHFRPLRISRHNPGLFRLLPKHEARSESGEEIDEGDRQPEAAEGAQEDGKQ